MFDRESLKYQREVDALRRKHGADLACFGEFAEMRAACGRARELAIGGTHRTILRFEGGLRHNENGTVPAKMVRNFGFYSISIEFDRELGMWVGQIVIERNPGNGRTVSILKNPKTGRYELWGRGEGQRDREHRLECEPRFNTADRYETVSVLEPPTAYRRVERVSRADRSIIGGLIAEEAEAQEADA